MELDYNCFSWHEDMYGATLHSSWCDRIARRRRTQTIDATVASRSFFGRVFRTPNAPGTLGTPTYSFTIVFCLSRTPWSPIDDTSGYCTVHGGRLSIREGLLSSYVVTFSFVSSPFHISPITRVCLWLFLFGEAPLLDPDVSVAAAQITVALEPPLLAPPRPLASPSAPVVPLVFHRRTPPSRRRQLPLPPIGGPPAAAARVAEQNPSNNQHLLGHTAAADGGRPSTPAQADDFCHRRYHQVLLTSKKWRLQSGCNHSTAYVDQWKA